MRSALRVVALALSSLASFAASTSYAQYFDPSTHAVPTDRLDPNDPPVIVALPAANVAAMVRFQQLLDAPAPVVDVDQALTKFVAELQSKTGLPWRVDRKALEDAGIEATCRLKGKFTQISLRSLLNLLLKDHDLVWRVIDESIVITTSEKANAHLETRVYLVGDIVKMKFDDGTFNDEFDELINVIRMNLEPTTWDQVGGPGSMRGYQKTHSLVVSQTAPVHNQIALLLNAIRRSKAFALRKPDRESKIHLKSSDSLPVDEKWRPTLFAPQSNKEPGNRSFSSIMLLPEKEQAARQRLLKLLDQPMDCDYRGIPLSDVIKSLAEKTGVNWHLDEKKLDEAGLKPDTAVEFSTPKISLRSLLNQMLRQLDLSYFIKDESFVVTTPEASSANEELHLYYVGDLVRIYDGENKYFDVDPLFDLITCSVSPTSWQDYSGPGPLRELSYSESVSFPQTQEVHEQVERLLAALRVAMAYYAKPGPQTVQPAAKTATPVKPAAPKPAPVRTQTPAKSAPRQR